MVVRDCVLCKTYNNYSNELACTSCKSLMSCFQNLVMYINDEFNSCSVLILQ